ncbi:MAG: type II toxin-antitoxin system VapC family toxin [Opitutales bacterium]
MIAVDSTVLADLLFGEERFSRAAADLRQMDPEWCCHGLGIIEVGNVAWKGVRTGRVDAKVAARAMEQMRRLPADIEWGIKETAILESALQHGLTFYDATHVWHARRRGVTLWTRDTRLSKACPESTRLVTVDDDPEPRS